MNACWKSDFINFARTNVPTFTLVIEILRQFRYTENYYDNFHGVKENTTVLHANLKKTNDVQNNRSKVEGEFTFSCTWISQISRDLHQTERAYETWRQLHNEIGAQKIQGTL